MIELVKEMLSKSDFEIEKQVHSGRASSKHHSTPANGALDDVNELPLFLEYDDKSLNVNLFWILFLTNLIERPYMSPFIR